MARNTSIANLAAEIANTIAEYTEEVSAAIAKTVDDTAKECKAEIVANSPPKNEEHRAYKGGWSIKSEDIRGSGITKRIIYNATEYQLVHLLEYGHAKRGGGRVAGIPHVEPAEQKAKDKLVTEIRTIIKRGG
jgi:hypothetical protein